MYWSSTIVKNEVYQNLLPYQKVFISLNKGQPLSKLFQYDEKGFNE